MQKKSQQIQENLSNFLCHIIKLEINTKKNNKTMHELMEIKQHMYIMMTMSMKKFKKWI